MLPGLGRCDMPDGLKGVRLLIHRATSGVDGVERVLNEFNAGQPYSIACQRDPDTRRLRYVVDRVVEIPEEIRVIAGEAVHGLRSALDHLAMQLWISQTKGNPQQARHVYFPIMRDAATYQHPNNGAKRRIDGLSPAAIAAIDAIQPYGGGRGEELWVLHELDNTAKHRLLLAVGTAYSGVELSSDFLFPKPMMEDFCNSIPEHFREEIRNVKMPRLRLNPKDRLCPLKAGDCLFTDLPDAEPHPEMRFWFDVSLHEPPHVVYQPIMKFLRRQVAVVTDVVTQLEGFV